MHLNEYQAEAMRTKEDPESITPSALWAMGLAGETGEVLERVKKVFRDDGGVYTNGTCNQIKKELGDVLWYLSVLADTLGFSLQEVAMSNLDKLRDRHRRGVLGGEGDER